MTINLEEWVGKRVRVTKRYGTQYEDNVLIRNSPPTEYPYYLKGKMHTGFFYKKDGTSSWINGYYDIINGYYDIIHIEEIPMNTEQLEQQIKETQEQLTKLQEELKKVQEQEKFNSEFYSPIGSYDELMETIKFLKTKDRSYLNNSFNWYATPQGFNYWRNKEYFTKEDCNLIRKWVANYVIKQDLNDF
jgi:hypothetical protein